MIRAGSFQLGLSYAFGLIPIFEPKYLAKVTGALGTALWNGINIPVGSSPPVRYGWDFEWSFLWLFLSAAQLRHGDDVCCCSLDFQFYSILGPACCFLARHVFCMLQSPSEGCLGEEAAWEMLCRLSRIDAAPIYLFPCPDVCVAGSHRGSACSWRELGCAAPVSSGLATPGAKGGRCPGSLELSD